VKAGSSIKSRRTSEGSDATLNGLYIVNGTQHIDNHTKIDHAMPHGTSHEMYKGILDGKSHAVFNGKIIVRKDAQKTDSAQSVRNLLLADDAIANARPQLEILADDVKCTHGATVGQIDQTALFYMKSRGVNGDTARRLLTYAFAADVLETLQVEAVKNALERMTLERFV